MAIGKTFNLPKRFVYRLFIRQMLNVNAKESAFPPNGGNVDESHIKASPVSESPSKLLDEQSLHDVDPLDPSTQTQTDSSVEERCLTSQDRERIIKELGVTSTEFIGPACRPGPSIENELSEFYKELEEVDQAADDTANKPVKEHGVSAFKSDQMNIPVVVTDHSRAYRPYPDPHERKQKDLKRWRPRLHPEPWYPPPPPWVPPDPRVYFFPPPTSGGPVMYPPDMPRPLEDFHSFQANNNNSWGPWQGPPVSSDRWHELRPFQSHERPGFSEEYQTPAANLQQHSYENEQNHQYFNSALVLILLRGVPGSGKSTLARELMSTGPNGVTLSTDDYFFQDNRYVFDSTLLGDAHDWNQKRAEQAMMDGCSPVIIDNTNVRAWEMKPYVEMAIENGYRVDFFEPDTNWKYDPAQLEKRNKHGVPKETIAKMLDGFEWPMNVDIVMNSVMPPHKSKGH